MGENTVVILILISTLVIVGLAIGVLVLYNVSQSRIILEVEEAHKKELAYKEELLSNSIEVQERERSRIAKDLHDEIGSKLNIVNLSVNLLKSSINRSSETDQILEQIEMSLTDSIDRARTISHDLLPPILAKFGIQSAINALVSEVNRTGAIKMSTDIGEEWVSITKDKELHLYRIIQELVNNSLKHSKAKNIYISSVAKNDKIHLSYKDDGIGIHNLSVEKIGLGMSSIHTRADIMGAKFVLDEESEGGFSAEIIF